MTQIETRDTTPTGCTTCSGLGEPYRIARTTSYSYRDPAYDRWTRTFEGFRKVTVRRGDETAVTVTTNWFSECLNDRFDARPDDTADVPSLRCEWTSDRDFRAPANGLPTLIERFAPDPRGGPSRYLWTKQFYYTVLEMYGDTQKYADDLRVAGFTYPFLISTTFYDPTQPTSDAGSLAGGPGADRQPNARFQAGARTTAQRLQRDYDGNLVMPEDDGLGVGADTQTVTVFANDDSAQVNPPPTGDALPLSCNADWECKPTYVLTYGRYADGGSVPVRKLRFHYELPNNTGAITETAGFQNVVTNLDRHHAAGGAVAPSPPNQSGLGWVVLSASAYDNLGNLSQAIRGPNMTTPECVTISYDAAYQHLGATVRRFVAGCGGASVDSALAFDRGFGVQTGSVSLALGRTMTALDPFGRPLRIFRPAETDPTQTTLAVTIAYPHELGPGSLRHRGPGR